MVSGYPQGQEESRALPAQPSSRASEREGRELADRFREFIERTDNALQRLAATSGEATMVEEQADALLERVERRLAEVETRTAKLMQLYGL